MLIKLVFEKVFIELVCRKRKFLGELQWYKFDIGSLIMSDRL